jgi:hypothetical protein
MGQSTVVVHEVGGKVQKGMTADFFPNKDRFHLTDRDSGQVREVRIRGLKAIFFVKSFEGDRAYNERQDVERAGFGKKIKVRFKDGETQVGYTQGFSPARPGFFFFPADPDANNERIFVVNAATADVRFV